MAAWPYPAAVSPTLHVFPPTPPGAGALNFGTPAPQRTPLQTPTKTFHAGGYPPRTAGAVVPFSPQPHAVGIAADAGLEGAAIRGLSPTRGTPAAPGAEAQLQREADLVGLVKELSQENGRLKGELEMVRGENEMLRSDNDALRSEVEEYRNALRTGRLRSSIHPAAAHGTLDASPPQHPLPQPGSPPRSTAVGRVTPAPALPGQAAHVGAVPPHALPLAAEVSGRDVDAHWDTCEEDDVVHPSRAVPPSVHKLPVSQGITFFDPLQPATPSHALASQRGATSMPPSHAAALPGMPAGGQPSHLAGSVQPSAHPTEATVAGLQQEVAELRAMCSTMSGELQMQRQHTLSRTLPAGGALTVSDESQPQQTTGPNSPHGTLAADSHTVADGGPPAGNDMVPTQSTAFPSVAMSRAASGVPVSRKGSAATSLAPQLTISRAVSQAEQGQMLEAAASAFPTEPRTSHIPVAAKTQAVRVPRAHSTYSEMGGKTPAGSVRVSPAVSAVTMTAPAASSRPQSQAQTVSSLLVSRTDSRASYAGRVKLGFVGDQWQTDARGKPQIIVSFAPEMCLADRGDDIAARLGIAALNECRYFLNNAKLPEVSLSPEPIDPNAPLSTLPLKGSQAVVYVEQT